MTSLVVTIFTHTLCFVRDICTIQLRQFSIPTSEGLPKVSCLRLQGSSHDTEQQHYFKTSLPVVTSQPLVKSSVPPSILESNALSIAEVSSLWAIVALKGAEHCQRARVEYCWLVFGSEPDSVYCKKEK